MGISWGGLLILALVLYVIGVVVEGLAFLVTIAAVALIVGLILLAVDVFGRRGRSRL